MIQPNELRIGNLLDVDGNYWRINSIVKTDSLSGFELYFEENDLYDHALNAKPIPLTEEWLVINFFAVLQNGNYILYNQYGDVVISLTKAPVGRWMFFTNGLSVIIEYVHQLQNLYHALTQKELELKQLV